MPAFTPAVHNATTNKHTPLAVGDTLDLAAGTVPAAAVSGVLASANLPAASETASGAAEVATQAEVNAGVDTTRFVTPATLAGRIALLGADVNIASMSYNATTGVLTITETDASVHSITISDAEIATVAAPATTVDPDIPTTRFGAGASYVGTPDGWFSINGKKVPFFN